MPTERSVKLSTLPDGRKVVSWTIYEQPEPGAIPATSPQASEKVFEKGDEEAAQAFYAAKAQEFADADFDDGD